MCLGDREAPFVQGEAGKGNGRTMGEHGLVWGEKQPGAGSSQELPTLTHTQTHRLPCLFTKHPPASSPPSPALLSHAGCPEPPTSHLPGHVPTFPRTPRTHRSHLRRSQEKKKKKKSSGKPPAPPRPLQHAPLPPPPSTFEKCLQKGEYFLSLVSTWPTQPGQSLPARAGVPSPLCSAVPARLCPQTSIVHYRR